ncbi:MAG: hypothetical protein LBC02_01490 [Planctomycetaceae bacterium]|nr:hypothetical protein [Planctomycetaceae bacterium]
MMMPTSPISHLVNGLTINVSSSPTSFSILVWTGQVTNFNVNQPLCPSRTLILFQRWAGRHLAHVRTETNNRFDASPHGVIHQGGAEW